MPRREPEHLSRTCWSPTTRRGPRVGAARRAGLSRPSGPERRRPMVARSAPVPAPPAPPARPIRHIRTALSLVCAVAVISVAAAVPAAASNPTFNRVDSAAGWLARQLTDGDHFEVVFDGTT